MFSKRKIFPFNSRKVNIKADKDRKGENGQNAYVRMGKCVHEDTVVKDMYSSYSEVLERDRGRDETFKEVPFKKFTLMTC